MAKKRFIKDIDILFDKIKPYTSQDVMSKLLQIRERFIHLSKKRLVKINHSIMQLLCAKYLIENGYRVEIEYPLNGGVLVADIFGVRERILGFEEDPRDAFLSEMHGISEDEETLVLEVETGYVPPKGALNPGQYRLTRIASKIARYAGFSHKFSLATPHYHVLQIPKVMLDPVGHRDKNELSNLKALCDAQYFSPPILFDELATSEIQGIFVVNVDAIKVLEVDPQYYRETVMHAEGVIQI
ncbi:hypothetical protein EU527_02575 [Candidatus Thorarchaeota archaeon]|nr:MAG: hypothetical protein EU527_02575 [Candidatus Thorarchaeota archaeon]